uniref:F-box domain-containing protein n=1 Tax=Oryza meridionalis TaxID=40149 RepID=A0A0E0BZZ5_9ORYZ
MAATIDRISDLPDDLIQRILHFVPAKEAASTGLLSTHRGDDFFPLHDAFVRSAHAALAAAATERLSVQLTADAFLHRDPQDWERKHDVVAGVISHPVARRVKELRVTAVKSADGPSSDKEVTEMEGEFRLSLGGSTQPSETLRVLDLTGCGGFSLSVDAALPRLTTLRLQLCVVQVKDLQGVVDSAPALATVHLESVFLAGTKEDGCARTRPGSAPRRRASGERGKEKKRERERERERERKSCAGMPPCVAAAAALSWPRCPGSGRQPSRLPLRGRRGKEKKREE